MRKLLTGAAAAALLVSGGLADRAQAETTLRLSHQWSTSDVRHQVAEIIKTHVEEAGVDLSIQIFPTQSLFKAREQWQPTSRGQLDMTVFPLAYAGGIHPEFNLTLMPGLVKSHEHAARLNASPFMDEIKGIAEDSGVKILVDGYLAGGFAGKESCITSPDDVQGLQTRAAGKAFEQMLASAGASIASMASSEIYNAMQTGVLDAANTSSSSFVSFRIYEQVACFTPVADYALWFMYQPVLISMRSWERLDDAQRAALEAGAEKAEAFYFEEAKKQDANARRVFEENGVEIALMTEAEFNAWREIAAQSSYEAFVESVPDGQRLLDKALAVE
ncbi:TRAP transporter substrate-binding protein DctP [Algihabitans albus]|uniref:TRAP transporter substrate-binding protein DctP n=1 Tax=Algihabitans albus TaxID=2164067 RepID=UPI0035D08A7C